MLRHLWEEGEALAVEGGIPRFFAARRQPVAIEEERGRLPIVGIAEDAQHGAAPAGDKTRRHFVGEAFPGRVSSHRRP